jgi:cyclopropane fatty-acyl-phospholipid synthase-like methyltransferase
MTTEPDRQFPVWTQIYDTQEVETMPWYCDTLDPDLEAELNARKISTGALVDIGTGPGTQAIALAQRGLSVTATDLSGTAVQKAKERALKAGASVTFVEDNVLESTLTQQFEYAFDRGCFHVFAPSLRAEYVRTVARLVAPGGLLFLKCFSVAQPGEQGPYRFTPEQLDAVFEREFERISSIETVYQGTREPQPKALFNVLKRR